MLNGDGTIVLGQSLNQGALSESINQSSLPAGTYYIKVSLGAGSTSASYSLNYQAQNTPYKGIAWRNDATGENAIWQIDGITHGASGSPLPSAPVHWQMEAAGDFNGDGQQDLVFRDRSSGDIRIWLLDGVALAGISASVGTSTDPAWQIRGVGDFNGDGKSDLVWRNQISGQNAVWFLNGTTYQGLALLPETIGANWQIQGVGDFNGDGKSDLVWRDLTGGDNAVWFLNGTSLSSIAVISNLHSSYQLQAVGDLTGDGRSDLFWRSANGEGSVWAMNGTAVTSSFAILPKIEDLNWRVAATITGLNAPTPIDVAGTAGSAFNIGTLNGSGSYGDTVSSSDQDVYTFSLTQAARVNLNVSGGVSAALGSQGFIAYSDGSQRLALLLAPGTYSIQVSTGSSSPVGYTLKLDSPIPVPSVPSVLQLAPGSDSGASASDRITKVKTPTITGRADAGTTVQVFNGSQLLGATTADGSGNWQLTTGTLADGVYSLKAKALNGLGDFSADSAVLSVVIDTQAPVTPIVDKINGQNIDDPSYFSQVYPLVEGRAEPNSLVRLFIDGLAVDLLTPSISQTTLAANGSWGAKIFGLLDGIHTLTTTATDLAGNVSTLSTPKTVRNDISAPTLTLTTPISTTQLSPGARLTGSASDNRSGLDVITYQFDDRTPILISFGATGAFDQAIDFTGITNGQHSLRIRVADRVGFYRMDAFSVTVVVDQTPPLLSVGLLQDTAIGGTNTDRVTANPTVQGTVTDASRITALRGGFENRPNVLVDVPTSLWQSAGGTFTLSRTQLDAFYGGVLPDGAHTLRLQAQDEYGNVVNTNFAFTLDTTPPIAPSLQWVTATVNGQVQNSIRGQAEANAVVKVNNNGKFLGQAIVGTDGAWSLSLSGALTGDQLFTATATDNAGNESLVSPTLKVVNGIVAALAPTNLSLAIASDSGTLGDSRTQVKAPTIVGKSEASAQIQLFVDGVVSGSTVASAAGDWSVTLATPLAEGVRVITATAKQLQGSLSVFSLPLALTIDSVPPTVTLSQTPQTVASWTRLVGSIANEAAGVSLAYQIDGSTFRPVTVGADGNFNQRFDLTNLTLNPQSPHTLTLKATDAAGNTTTQSFTVTVVTSGTDPATVLPVLGASLLRDTAAKGTTNTDRVTSDPTVIATIASPNSITAVEAQIVGVGSGFTVLSLRPDAAGQITLDRSVLEALNGGTLLDGGYTLNLRVKDQFNNLSSVVSVALTLQTQIPSLSLTDLPDGVSWDLDQVLAGEVSGGQGLALSYRLDGGVETPVSFSAGAFESLLPLTSLGLGSHVLTVTARDLAGNEQAIQTDFLLKQDQPLLDTEPDSRSTSNPNPKTPPVLTTTKSREQSNVPFIEGLSAGGSPGNGDNRNPLYTGTYWRGGSDWNDNYAQEEATGSGYGTTPVELDISYVDRIQTILDQANDVMATGPRRAALRGRRPVLLEVAQQVEAGSFYEPMYPGLYGIYAMAAQVTKKSEARRIGDYLALQITDPSDPAVRVQTFQTETLAAIRREVKRRGVALNASQQQELGKAALSLAYVYSQLDPKIDAERTQKDFLGQLWRAQGQPDASLVALAGNDLRDLLLEVPSDRLVTTVSFLGNLLKAANGVQDLNQGGDLKNPVFLRELVKFGVEYAKLNPDTSLSQEPQGWLDELWRAGSTPGAARNRAVKKGAAGLSAFLGGMEAPQGRIEGVKFGGRLLKADALLTGNGLEIQKRDPKFVEALVGLGGSYMTLRSKSSSKGDIGINQNLFLDAMWRTENIQKGAEDIQRFLAQISSTDTKSFLEFQSRVLYGFQELSDNENFIGKTSFISEMMDWGEDYYLDTNDHDDELTVHDPLNFFQSVMSATNSQEISNNFNKAKIKDLKQIHPLSVEEETLMNRMIVLENQARRDIYTSSSVKEAFANSLSAARQDLFWALRSIEYTTNRPARIQALAWALKRWMNNPSQYANTAYIPSYGQRVREFNGSPTNPISTCNRFVGDAYAIGVGVGYGTEGEGGRFPTGRSFPGDPRPGYPVDANELSSMKPATGVLTNLDIISSPQIGDIVSFHSDSDSEGHTGLLLGHGLYISARRSSDRLGDQVDDGVMITKIPFSTYQQPGHRIVYRRFNDRYEP